LVEIRILDRQIWRSRDCVGVWVIAIRLQVSGTLLQDESIIINHPK